MNAETGAVRRGLVDRVLGAWAGPRAEMRRLLADRPSEATLLSLLMIAALFGVMARFIDHSAQRWDPNAPEFVAAWQEREDARLSEAKTEIAEAFAANSIDAAERDRRLGALVDPATLSGEARSRALAAAMSDKLTRDRLEMLIGSFLIFPLGVYLFAAAAHPLLRVAGGEGGGYETRAAFIWAAVIAAPVGFAAQLLIVFTAMPDALRAGLGVAVLSVLLFFIANCLAEAHRLRSAASILGGLLAFLVGASVILWLAQAAL